MDYLLCPCCGGCFVARGPDGEADRCPVCGTTVRAEVAGTPPPAAASPLAKAVARALDDLAGGLQAAFAEECL